MDIKRLSSKILAAILGIIIVNSLVNLLVVIIFTIFLITAQPESINDWVWLSYSFVGLSSIIAGIYLGLRSYKTKDTGYKIFKPTKKNTLVSLILSLCLSTILLMYSGPFVNSYNLAEISKTVAIPASFISYFLLFYVFSALCVFIYNNRKERSFKKHKAIIITLLILLNPLFIVYGSSMGAIYRHSIVNEPCGLKIAAFNDLSPAQESGMQVNETIIKIDDTKIDSLNDLKEYMGGYDAPSDMTIYTKMNSYNIKPLYQDGNYLLGISVLQQMCKRSLKK